MVTARAAQTATLLPGGKVLVAGGRTPDSDAVTSAELYDPATNTWSSAGTMSAPRASATATLLPDGQVLVAGGYTGSDPAVNVSAELYDPMTNAWAATGSLGHSRGNQTATLLPGGKVLIAGGFDGINVLGSAELYGALIAPPSVALITPAVGATYDLGQAVTASFTCTDVSGGPGIQTCSGTVNSGQSLDTATAGPHTFTVTATTIDGRTATVTRTYTVRKAPTALDAGPLLLKLGPLLSLPIGQASAKLTYGAAGTAAAGRTVTFKTGTTTLCTATTNAGGTATCSFSVPGLLLTLLTLKGYTATFAGDANLQPSSDTGPLVRL